MKEGKGEESGERSLGLTSSPPPQKKRKHGRTAYKSPPPKKGTPSLSLCCAGCDLVFDFGYIEYASPLSVSQPCIGPFLLLPPLY